MHFPDANITLLNYGLNNDEMDYNFNGKLVRIKKTNMRFSKKFYLKNNIARLILVSIIVRLIPIKWFKERLIAQNYYLDVIDKSDIIASMAGGDSFSDIYGLRRFLYVSLPQILSIVLGKKIVQLPQTYGPFCKPITKFLAKHILRNSCSIYSRDYHGVTEVRELLKRYKDDEKVKFSYDVGFIVEPTSPSLIDKNLFDGKREGQLLVGLNVSGLLYMGGYSKKNMFNLKVNYRDLIHALIETVINEWKAYVILVPHVFGEYHPNSETDQAVCEQIYEDLKAKYKNKLLYQRGKYDHREIKYIIGNCDFFMGSRMHACIAAISQSIPTVPIAYSQKFMGVMQTVGIGQYVVDLRESDIKEVIRIAEAAWQDREKIRKGLEDKIPEVKEDVFKMFEESATKQKVVLISI